MKIKNINDYRKLMKGCISNMYNIGIFSLNDREISMIDFDMIKKIHKIIEITTDIENIEDLQAVIIQEEEITDMSTICEMILKIKQKSNCYIWIATVSENSVGKLVYLQLGADVVFGPDREVREVSLIVENALGRIASKNVDSSFVEKSIGKNGLFELNPSNLSVFLDEEKEVVLTRLEYKIVELLLNTPNIAVDYETVYKKIWGDDLLENKKYRVANVIYHLRQKIEKNIKKPEYIKTVRSKGYMLSI